MKKIIIPAILVSALAFVACRKTRTCACTESTTTETVSTPRNGGSQTKSNTSTTSNNEGTYAKVKKSDMRRFGYCNSRSQTSANTYTTVSYEGFPGTAMVVDVRQTNVTETTCEIK